MIKIFLSFFTLIIFTNNSYASFPVSDTLKVNHDTIIKESVKDYHLRLQKMGFELESGKKIIALIQKCQVVVYFQQVLYYFYFH